MNNLTMKRGDTVVHDIPVTLDGEEYNLAGCQLRFTAKRSKGDADGSAVIRKGSTGTSLTGIVITSEAEGMARLTINPADTSGLTEDEKLYWDLQLKTSGGAVYTIDEGWLLVDRDVSVTA